MGWDTEVIILAENLKGQSEIEMVASLIYKKDAKSYEASTCFSKDNNVLFYHFERRKYIPFWVIQEISKDYPHINFTLLGSCVDFVCGPCGIMRISEGILIESYGIGFGFGDDAPIRSSIILRPIRNIQIIYYWYKYGGQEDFFRNQYVNDFPKIWYDNDLVDYIIQIEDTSELKKVYSDNQKSLQSKNWEILETKRYQS